MPHQGPQTTSAKRLCAVISAGERRPGESDADRASRVHAALAKLTPTEMDLALAAFTGERIHCAAPACVRRATSPAASGHDLGDQVVAILEARRGATRAQSRPDDAAEAQGEHDEDLGDQVVAILEAQRRTPPVL